MVITGEAIFQLLFITLQLHVRNAKKSPLHITLHYGHYINQRTNGPVNAHLISLPTKAQNIQNLENIW